MTDRALAAGGGAVAAEPAATHVRYTILAILFIVTTVNLADRAALSIAGPAAAKDLALNPAVLGYVLSAFGWAYVIGQIPAGWLLDRFGSVRVYALGIVAWSVCTLLQGLVGAFHGRSVVAALFLLVFLMGLAESPAFPGNARIVAAWFPARERGTASATFNSAQYAATLVFAPLAGWITQTLGWRYVFVVLGGLGILLTLVWLRTVRAPLDHPRANSAELEYIRRGGGMVTMDQASTRGGGNASTWSDLRTLLSHRTLIGVYVGQYCITTLTYFFLTWFPMYLILGRGMSTLKAGLGASLPALFGFCGGLLGGVFSDHLLKRGRSLTAARKTPIVLGMLLAVSMVACNYVNATWAVIGIMCVAFFGKGIGALGWAVMSDVAPKERAGLCGALFNTFGNTAAITTPIVIGHIVQTSGSFNGALVFVAANAITAIVCYLLVVGEIGRVTLGGRPVTVG